MLTHSGYSVVDYTIASSSIFHFFTKFEIMLNDEYTHLPQCFSMKFNNVEKGSTVHCKQDITTSTRNVFRWTEKSAEKPVSNHMNILIDEFHSKLENSDINDATRLFTDSLQCLH